MKVLNAFALVLTITLASTSFALGKQERTEYIDVPADEAAMAQMPADQYKDSMQQLDRIETTTLQKRKVQIKKKTQGEVAMEAVIEAVNSPLTTLQRLIRPVTTLMNPSSAATSAPRTSGSK